MKSLNKEFEGMIKPRVSREVSLQTEARTRKALESNHLAFCRYVYKAAYGRDFHVVQHHRVLCQVIDRVLKGEIKRLLINIPPRYGKTEVAVIMAAAHGFALNPQSKIIHSSYSDDLARKNSRHVRDMISSPTFKKLWNIGLRGDSKSVNRWDTTAGGSFNAMSMQSGVTGFGTGGLQDGSEWKFNGMLIIDDPLKAIDAHSEAERQNVVSAFTDGFLTRQDTMSAPIIIIGQRLHEEDLFTYLLEQGTGEKWHHLVIPAINGIELTDEKLAAYQETVQDKAADKQETTSNVRIRDIEDGMVQTNGYYDGYPNHYKFGIPITYRINKGALWPQRRPMESLLQMKQSNPAVFYSQYMQQPTPIGGAMILTEWLRFYEHEPDLKHTFMTCDTAAAVKKESDYTVFQWWGYGKDDKLYLLEQLRGRYNAPDLYSNFLMFYNRCRKAKELPMRRVYIENASSGIGLIQMLDRKFPMIPVLGINRNIGKAERAYNVCSYIEQGMVVLPKNATFINELVEEIESFSPKGTHRHDDMCDCLFDAIYAAYYPEAIGEKVEALVMTWD